MDPQKVPQASALDYQLGLSAEVERAVRLPADNKILNYAPLGFRFWVTRGEPLVLRDEEEWLDFRERTWRAVRYSFTVRWRGGRCGSRQGTDFLDPLAGRPNNGVGSTVRAAAMRRDHCLAPRRFTQEIVLAQAGTLRRLFEKHGTEVAILFGSLVTPGAEGGDLDLAVAGLTDTLREEQALCRHFLAVQGVSLRELDTTNVIELAGRTGLLPVAFAQRIRGMAGVRNAIVHADVDLDYAAIHEMVTRRPAGWATSTSSSGMS